MIDKKTSPIECSCGGYHYIQVDIWDEGTGEKVIAFIQEPATLWELLKGWWHHRQCYVDDIILTKEQIEELRKLLN